MKLTVRDALSTLLLAAVAVPYIGYLVNGEMPFIKDPRGMSGVGLALGALMFVAAGVFKAGRLGRLELGVAAGSMVLGLIALFLAETAAAEALLAVFMVSLLVGWAVTLLDHAGFIHIGAGPVAHSH